MRIVTTWLMALGWLFCVHGASVHAAEGSPLEKLAGEWDSECHPQGCLMFHDVLPAGITIAVALEPGLQKAAFISFQVPAEADKTKGLSLAFTKTVPDGGKWKAEVLNDLTRTRPFDSCENDTCVVRFANGMIKGESGKPDVDLLQEFLSRNLLLMMYVSESQYQKGSTALFAFVRDYKALVAQQKK